MWISYVEIQNFRCIGSLQLGFSRGLNTLVGENSVGKSSLFTAISKTIQSALEPKTAFFVDEDLRYGRLDGKELKVNCKLELNEQEQKQLLERMLSAPLPTTDRESLLRRLGDYLRSVEIGFSWDEINQFSYVKIGQMFLQKDWVTSKLRGSGAERGQFHDIFVKVSTAEDLENKVLSVDGYLRRDGILQSVVELIGSHFKSFDEFRVRPIASKRSDVVEALTGTGVANVLLNLKNNPVPKQRNMYRKICSEFSNFIPSLAIESVDTSPGGGIADVQIIEEGKDWAIPLANIGAGIAELLTFITNLVAREDNIYVIEEPEMHLHAHTKRRFYRLAEESSKNNQIFVITHDEHFVDSANLRGLIRLYITGNGTEAAFLPPSISPKILGQLYTALKSINKREVVFARAVLLVEDESQEKFVLGCANKLSQDLDGAGVSVLFVDGEDAFKPYITLVESLKIPYLCLRDKDWGSHRTKPPKVFRALGCELEEFFEKCRLDTVMKEAKQKVGTGKARVADYVARTITKRQVPSLVSQLITDVMKLAKGEIL